MDWQNKYSLNSYYWKQLQITYNDHQITLQIHCNKTARHWHKSRHVDQWNTIEDSEIDPEDINIWVFKNCPNHTMEKKTAPSAKGAG
jgi:hypothetical protein